MRAFTALAFACCSLAISQTLSLRNEMSPQALELATADFESMSGPVGTHSVKVADESEIEGKLLKLAQVEINSEGDLFSEKSPGANDLRLYYLLRVTRQLKWAVEAQSHSGKPDNRLLGREVSCDNLSKVTI